MVLEADWASNDTQTIFKHPHGLSNPFFWPGQDDVCWMPPLLVTLKLNPATTSNGWRAQRVARQKKDFFFEA